MKKVAADKEMLFMMLTEINDQLEELEGVLESSFSDHRNNCFNEELGKIASLNENISILEKKVQRAVLEEFSASMTHKKLNFELGI